MSEKKRKREERKRDVLPSMLVTLDVFHFERSPLNAKAEANATQKKQKDKKYTEKRK